MALKRPPEKKWNFKQPPEPFPPCPSRGCFLAPSGQGKTTTIVAMMLGPYSKCFRSIHVFSPSVEIDSAWDPVRDFAKGLPDPSSFNSEWDEGKLLGILEEQKQKIRTEKDGKKKTLSQVLICIDDFADRYDIMHNAANVMTTLFIRGRHFGANTWISSQKLSAISLVARVNFQFMLIWRMRNYREMQAIFEELSALYPVDVLREMYELATEEPHSFWFILLTAKRKEEMFFKRFEERMTLDI